MKDAFSHASATDTECPSLKTLIEKDPNLCAVWTAMCSNLPFIFVSGPAGTGKSTFIRSLLVEMRGRHLLVAPTGVAALNIDGSTIHSALRVDPNIPVYLPELIEPVPSMGHLRRLERIIIDEISMVRSDLLDVVDRRLRDAMPIVRGHRPFGGVQVVVFGDLFQLPPIVEREDEEHFGKTGDWQTPFFFSAHALEGLPLKMIPLTSIYRQHDVEAQEMLAAIRHGKVDQVLVDRLNARCHHVSSLDEMVRLVSYRRSADHINISKLDAIPERERAYQARYEGRFVRDRIGNDRLPAPDPLKLKRSALVMFTKNDPGRRWVNGSLGVIESLDANAIHVRVPDSGATYEVFRETWEKAELVRDDATGRYTREIRGTYTQFPLMLAWAITIHKAQGKTLSKVVVDYEGGRAFAPGQTYVALSRTRSLSDIHLTRPITLSDIRADKRIVSFYKQVDGTDPPPQRYGDLRFRRRADTDEG